MRAEDVLPGNTDEIESNGMRVRKGAVGAFLANVRTYGDPAATDEARATALHDIEEGLPALKALGLFDVFDIRDRALRALVDRRIDAPAPADTVDLDALYAPPAEMIQKAVLGHLIDEHRAYLRAATFFCLATGSAHGLDASPRGGPPGFVHVLDPYTIAFADWPGNNRIESMRNLAHDERLGMLFLFPGLEIFLRINGRGCVSTDPDLLLQLREKDRIPKTAIVVLIDEVIVHCGKAVNRARLWDANAQPDRTTLPSVGQMLAALKQQVGTEPRMAEEQIAQIDRHYEETVRKELY